MRRILVDYARSHGREKRGAGVAVQSLDEALTLAESRDVDLVALDDALKELEKIDPEGSRVVEMSFFAGLTQDEIAEVLKVSKMTVRRRWTAARLWLYRELKND
jgi:RNA polymerase sigma factor (TIGR02999 family)